MPSTEELKRHWAFNLPVGATAGGFIRDYLRGVTPEDIDIFVNCANAETLYSHLAPRMSTWNTPPSHTIPGRSMHSVSGVINPDYAGSIPTISTNRGMTWVGEEVNIIIMQDGVFDEEWKVINRFDYTVNMMAWQNGSGDRGRFHNKGRAISDLFNMKLVLNPAMGEALSITAERERAMLRKGFRLVRR